MKIQFVLVLATALALGACSSGTPTIADAPRATMIATPVSTAAPHETLLLVSLADGSVIMQTIHANADICFKNNAESLTTCLTQGAPILDPATDMVIGYEMIEDHIELIAKSD